MYGKVLEYPAKTIFRHGFRDGSIETSRRIAIRLYSEDWGIAEIARLLDEYEATVEEWVKD
ncbi:MAG: hypothetical protein LUB63_01315 [Oscillospiraceae bacterium]|nr:hypothetical protein [Oscillospiraceae bacterium]